MQANGEDDGIVKVAFANAEEQNAGGEILGFVFDLEILSSKARSISNSRL